MPTTSSSTSYMRTRHIQHTQSHICKYMYTQMCMIAFCCRDNTISRLNAGAETIVLHYMDLHAGRGVAVCPIHTIPTGAVHKEVLECFVEVCGCIRQTLWRRRSKTMAGEDDSSEGDDGEEEGEGQHPISTRGSSAPFLASPPCPTVIEQGVLLSCPVDQSAANKPSFDYWVVG